MFVIFTLVDYVTVYRIDGRLEVSVRPDNGNGSTFMNAVR